MTRLCLPGGFQGLIPFIYILVWTANVLTYWLVSNSITRNADTEINAFYEANISNEHQTTSSVAAPSEPACPRSRFVSLSLEKNVIGKMKTVAPIEVVSWRVAPEYLSTMDAFSGGSVFWLLSWAGPLHSVLPSSVLQISLSWGRVWFWENRKYRTGRGCHI